MRHDTSKSGFTLLEMLVASLLLGMLVTILTMVFNSSSIAWRTGKAGVAQMSKLRRQLSFAQHRADNLLPRVDVNNKNKTGFVVSPWCYQSKNGGKYVRTRAVQDASNLDLGFSKPSFSNLENDKSSLTVKPWVMVTGLGSLKFASSKSYVVSVISSGPDGQLGTSDDIGTWPDEVEDL